MPPVLLAQSVRRLRGLSLVVAIAFTAVWLVKNAIEGHLYAEFESPWNWGPPILIIVASAGIYGLVRSSRVAPATLATIGLVYEVVISFCLETATHAFAFQGLEAYHLTFDRIGVSTAGLWMILFTILVPNRPRPALIALLASGSAPPILYAVQARLGLAPSLEPIPFFIICILPYLMCAAMAYFAAVTIYRLGQDLRRAREMGSYRLDSLLGQGGMGEVWRARHRMLARPAAVKLIRPDALGSDPAAVDTAVRRFEQEAQITAGLQSPQTVELYDFGVSEEGTLYYVMELLDGVDLESMVRKWGPLPPERVVHLLGQVCASLEEAHDRGLVHRDIKPSNIFLCRYALQHDFVKVLDFGLAKRHSQLDGEELGMTRAGVVPGTPSFIPPEVALGNQSVDGRSDLYSLGCVAHWLLTGRMVFEEETPMAMVVAHINAAPVAPGARTELVVPEALDALVLQCLAKDPAERPESAGDLREKLAEIELPAAWTKERAARWWGAHQPSGG
jgi:serine/threonine-protein kinase